MSLTGACIQVCVGYYCTGETEV